MKVCVCAGQKVIQGGVSHCAGAVLELSSAEAEAMMAVGVVEKVKAPAKKKAAPKKKAKAEGAE
jgi:hypothetical protein